VPRCAEVTTGGEQKNNLASGARSVDGENPVIPGRGPWSMMPKGGTGFSAKIMLKRTI
jgi:hypothetical protein